MSHPDRSPVVRATAALLTLLSGLAALLAFTPPSAALPLFARKYEMPCTNCHLAVPRLNAFGMHFKQNGYRMDGAKGESPWESKEIPLSVVGNVGYDVATTDADDGTGSGDRVRTTLGQFQQNQVEFHSAGTLAERVTFHIDNDFAGAGGPLQSGMAFVQFDDLAKEGALNLKAGIFDADIPYLASSRSTTLHDYLSPVTLDGSGIELNGTRSSWTYALGLVNSERSLDSVLVSKPDQKSFNQLENVYAWVMKEIGGHLYTARVFLDRQNPRTLGSTSSQHVQAEVSAYLDRGRLTLIPGYTFQKFQDEPSGIPDESHIGMLEALYLFGKDSRWLATARYEHQYTGKTNQAPAPTDLGVGVLNLAYYVNPNARVGLDWAHTSDNVKGPRVDEVQAFVWVGY